MMKQLKEILQEDSLKKGSVEHMASLVNGYIDASYAEHQQYLNRGAKGKDHNQKKWDKAERTRDSYNSEFKKHFRHLIPEKDRHNFSIGDYNVENGQQFARYWHPEHSKYKGDDREKYLKAHHEIYPNRMRTEGYEPAGKDEGTKKFAKKHHVIKHKDAAGNNDKLFNASNVKTVKRSPHHGYEPGEDEKVYESHFTMDQKVIHEPTGQVYHVVVGYKDPKSGKEMYHVKKRENLYKNSYPDNTLPAHELKPFVKEENEEQLDEISHEKLLDYIAAADKEVPKNSRDRRALRLSGNKEKQDKVRKREAGITKAVRKIYGEETIDEGLIDKIKTAYRRMQVGKRVGKIINKLEAKSSKLQRKSENHRNIADSYKKKAREHQKRASSFLGVQTKAANVKDVKRTIEYGKKVNNEVNAAVFSRKLANRHLDAGLKTSTGSNDAYRQSRGLDYVTGIGGVKVRLTDKIKVIKPKKE